MHLHYTDKKFIFRLVNFTQVHHVEGDELHIHHLGYKDSSRTVWCGYVLKCRINSHNKDRRTQQISYFLTYQFIFYADHVFHGQ